MVFLAKTEIEQNIDAGNTEGRILRPLKEAFCGSLLAAGFLLCLSDMADNANLSTGLSVSVACISIAVACLLLSGAKRSVAFAIAPVALMAVSTTVLRSYTQSGAALLLRSAGEEIGSRSYIRIPVYEAVISGKDALCVNFTGILVSVFAAWGVLFLIRTKKTVFPLFPAILICAAVLFLHPRITVFSGMALTAGSIAAMLYVSEGARARFGRGAFGANVFLVVLPVIAFLIFAQAIPQQDYAGSSFFTAIREQVQEKIHALRYKPDKADSLTFGRLGSGNTETESGKTEETVLRVTMTDPQPLYLRGYIGSNYQDGKWSDLDNGTIYNSENMFYWMKKDGFDSLTSLSDAAFRNGFDGISHSDASQVTVENRKADSSVLYLPYELVGLEGASETASWREISGSYYRTGGIVGQRSYRFTMTENLTGKFTDLASLQYLDSTGNGAGDSWFQEESQYRAFVRENYLTVPESDQKIFNQAFGLIETSEPDTSHVSYSYVIQEIRSYLKKNMSYKSTAGNTGGTKEGMDVLTAFLNGKRSGNDAYFASAAVMMFRYYGIPARYAEGYLITSEDVKNAGSDEPVSVTGKDAHAWAEIYVDTLGWVPIEVLPQYEEAMPQADLKTGIEPKSQGTRTVSQNTETVASSGKVKGIQQLGKTLISIGQFGLLCLAVFDLLILVLFAYIFIRRIYENFRRRRQALQADYALGIQAMFRSLNMIMEHAGLKERGQQPEACLENLCSFCNREKTAKKRAYLLQVSESYVRATAIANVARYSARKPSKSERDEMRALVHGVKKTIIRNSAVRSRLAMEYVCWIC